MDDEILFILIGLAILALPILAIVAFVMAYNTRQRVRALESRLRLAESALVQLRREPPPASAPTPVETAVETPPAVEEQAPPEPEHASDAPADTAPEMPQEPADLPIAARQGLEERFGTRWAVWIGGLALALGGVFLVRASIEAGLLGPGARVLLGALFAAALIAGGEVLRRRTAPIPAFGSAYAPGALTAAGATTAFAVVYAAFALYGFIGPALAFVLLGAIALATMLAAALHGPALAAIGLLGGFAAPLLVSSADPSLWPLPIYLAFVAIAAYGVARLRRWRWLAIGAAVGAGLWALVLTVLAFGDTAPGLVHVLVQTALAAGAFVALPYGRDRAPRPSLDRVATGVLAGFAGLAVLALSSGDVGPTARIAFAGAMAALLTACAVRYAPAAGAALLAAGIVAGSLVTWPVAYEIAEEPRRVVPGGVARVLWPEALETFLAFGAIAALAIAAAAGARLLHSTPLLRLPAAALAAAASGTPLLVLVTIYWALTDEFRSLDAAPALPFTLGAAALAVAYTALAVRLQPLVGAEDGETPGRLLLAGAAAAALAALSAGLVFTLDRGLLTVALALSAAGSAWVADRTRIPTLRWAVGVLGFVVLMRLVEDPTVADDPGRTILLNWLLVGYGVPAVAFALAARLLDRTRRDGISRFSESLAFVFGAFLVFFQIRHALHGGDPLAETTSHVEMGLLATASLAFSVLATRLDLARRDTVTGVASLAFAALSMAFVVFGLAYAANPLVTDDAIAGAPLLNDLALAYALPAILAAILARAARAVRPAWFVEAAGWLALALGSAWIALAIRHAAQGAQIGIDRVPTEGEMWAYSAALVALALAALAYGLLRDVRRARLVGVAFLAAAVVKVFLVDLANLEGVMRALSFIGLGLALVGIGLAWQRLAARRPAAAAGGAPID
ncbi:DUF2339 domain-containing protein [Salinarimonas ramus]|uniref:Membrane protein n=1 Tax=Salinarimonas ramus TaxID=690164 RepID=A0A917Q8L9_9HYPH|nr:DUF2339 domain-containing protein [Salinarimonas ramus]GGK34709.1 membrane protein [Salinarimonas ramus]